MEVPKRKPRKTSDSPGSDSSSGGFVSSSEWYKLVPFAIAAVAVVIVIFLFKKFGSGGGISNPQGPGGGGGIISLSKIVT